ncbi:MAG: prolipoprotein diacylglyceryl transferase, partial [Omnitrophica WOR_2 bacterium RIFCSPHIGHO2_01_FULL_48_9]
MFPIILKIGPVTIYSYGLMMAVAVMVCVFLLSRDARSLGISSEKIFDFVFWVVLSGIAGARLFFILLNLDYFVRDPLEIVMLQKGGLAWQGSLIAGTVAALVYIRKQKLPLAPFLDIIAPYVALGQAIGRLGCFLNGCCYGKPLAWGIYFPVHQASLHPTQLYDALGLVL